MSEMNVRNIFRILFGEAGREIDREIKNVKQMADIADALTIALNKIVELEIRIEQLEKGSENDE